MYWGVDLQSEHERFLCDQHVQGPVAVTDYPKDIKAFYMKQNEDNKTVAAVDLLVPGVGEMIGGSQREEDLNCLDQRLSELNMAPEEHWWYRDLRKYGTVPHAGFGLGLNVPLCTSLVLKTFETQSHFQERLEMQIFNFTQRFGVNLPSH